MFEFTSNTGHMMSELQPPITSPHREEAHVVLPDGPEQLRGSDLIQLLSFAPHSNLVV